MQTLTKTKRNRRWKMPHTVLERRTFCFSSYKNLKLKVKLWCVGARQRKKAFSVPFNLSKGNFFNICVLSQCIVYSIHFQNIEAFIYQKHHFLHFSACFLNLRKSLVYPLVHLFLEFECFEKIWWSLDLANCQNGLLQRGTSTFSYKMVSLQFF